ncbi:variant erythrocyte surface antigen-1 family protein [Babesia caballi]|uniref:Variant erythrocyte surface antigen-1 family protein n=1 Tax=Babesia caballi TaxID=5871 RepID=A0AAV4LVH2_BABCB|nr:variant erythrocyte surface antigen-1 family protein [Babesia caballi]
MTTGKSLTDAPTNLKEAIGWVLCMSGNDVPSHYTSGQEAIKMLAEKITSLLANVRVQGVAVSTLIQGDAKGHGSLGSHAPINSLAEGLKHLVESPNGMGKNYKFAYYYHDLSNAVDDQIVNIFLGIIPLLFFGLGFLFWKCQGGWKTLALGSGPLKSFMDAVGFTGHIDTSKPASKAYNWFTLFDEFGRVDSTSKRFPEYLSEVEKKTK